MATGLNIPIAGKVYAESVTFTSTTIPGASTANKYVLGYGGAYLMYWSGQPLSPMTVGAGETVGTWSSNGTFTSKGTIGTFSYYNHVVNENHSGNGSVSGAGTYTIDDGSTKTITVTATPDAGWACTGLSNKPSFEPTTDAVSTSIALSGAGPTTIYATFERYYTIAFNKNGHGTKPSSISPCFAGSSYSLPSMSATGYKFLGWAESGSATTGFMSYTIPLNNPASKTLYAVWETHTVHFNANGGSGSMSDQHFAPGVAQNLKANAFSRSGYNFGGWALTADGAAVYGDNASVTAAAAGETTLYAVWTQLSVTYTNTGDSTKAPTYGSANQTVTLATAPSWTGYTFTGWMIGTQLYSAGANYTFGTTSVTATAHWTPIVYTISYNTNGHGTVPSGVKTSYNVESDTYTPPSPANVTGWHFTGWSPASIPRGSTGNKTFTAQWAGNPYIVKFDSCFRLSDGTIPMASQDFVYGTAQSLRPISNLFERTGYTFVKWNTKWDFTGTDYTDGQSVINLLTPATYNPSNIPVVKLYALWNIHSWAVTFDANGGTGGWSLSMDYGAKITAPTVTRTGYAFAGWSSDVATTVPDNDVTYTAQWTAHKYYINFGGVARDPLYRAYDEVVEISPPTRENYVFTGWTVSGVDSLVAKWGTTNNPTTNLKNNDKISNGSGSVWVKNLTSANQTTNPTMGDNRIVLTANWERIAYSITARQSSSSWDIRVDAESGLSGDEIAGFPHTLDALKSGESVKVEPFTAYAGGEYRITATMKPVSLKAYKWYIPISYGGKALSRQSTASGAPAKFTANYTFAANETSPQTWNNSFVYVQVVNGENPLNEDDTLLRPTMSLVDGTDKKVRVVAPAETSKSAFLSWGYDPEAVTPVSQEGNVIVVPVASSNIVLTANYKRRTFEAAAEIDAATASAISGVEDPPTLSVTVSSGGATNTSIVVGYGLSATWTFSISNPPEGFSSNYEFAGWFTTATPSSPDEKPAYTDASVTLTVTQPIKLYARMRAKVKFIVDNGSAEGTRGGIAVNNGEIFPVLPVEAFYIIGSTISISAKEMNADTHFNGWFEGGTSHENSDRIPGFGPDSQYMVVNATVLIAYFAATAEVFYIALYQRNAATRSYNDFQNPYGTLALVESVGEVDRLNNWEAYKNLVGFTPPYQAKGVYYQITGIRRVDATLTQTPEQTTGVKRVVRGYPAKGAVLDEVQIANGMPFSAVIDENCVFVVDFGDVSHRELVADVVSQPGSQVGGVAKVLNAEAVTGWTDVSETGRYEIGRPAVAYAIPDNGYKFDGWYSAASGGTLLSKSVRYEFPMPAFPANSNDPYHVYAKFSLGSFALYKWEGSAKRKQLTWKSKVYELSKPANLTSVRVDATTLNDDQPAYPLARFRYESFSSPNAQAPNAGVVDFTVGEKDRRLQSQDMRRLPYVTPEGRHIRPERYFQVEVENAAEVDSIVIGTSGGGLAT